MLFPPYDHFDDFPWFLIISFLYRACKLIIIPENGVQDFEKGAWPMQNLSERDFFKKKRYG